MYIRTPYRTGMGMNLRMGASLTESPVRRNTQMPVTRCSLTNESSIQLTNQRQVLPDPLKLRGLPGGATLAVHLEAVHMTQAENSGRHTPIIITTIIIITITIITHACITAPNNSLPRPS